MMAEHINLIIILSLIVFSALSVWSLLLARRSKAAVRVALGRVAIAKREALQAHETIEYISREMHDNIRPMLSIIKMNIESVVLLPSMSYSSHRQEQDERLKNILEVANSLQEELENLNKTVAVEASQLNFVDSLKKYIKYIRTINAMTIGLHIIGEPVELGNDRNLVLFRICQEAINNALKHSHGSQLTVSVIFKPEKLIVYLMDNGRGFELHPSSITGNGLANMSFRASLIGAELETLSAVNKGTSVNISIPYSNESKL